jgi:hypothetical protein
MIDRLRQRIARWTPVFEYLLVGNPKLTTVAGVLLLLGWYTLSGYWWPVLIADHEELEFVFLLPPIATLVLWAARIRIGIDQERIANPPPQDVRKRFGAKTWAVMYERVQVGNRAVHNYFCWRAAMLRKAHSQEDLSIDEIPTAWRGRPTYWCWFAAKTAAQLLLVGFLLSPWQCYLGDPIARGLDQLWDTRPGFDGGEVCPPSSENCMPMKPNSSPGDQIELSANAPDYGRLRFFLRNRPRSGRYVHFTSSVLYVTDPRHTGTDICIPARGAVVEVPYIINATNVWALWADVEYFRCDLADCSSACRGEKYQTAAYTGIRLPAAVPPDRYRGH